MTRGIPEYVAQVVSYVADGESLVWAESAAFADAAAGIRVPVLAMVGEQTFDEIRSAADALAAGIPGARVRVMPGADHTWEPVPMAAELAAFVTACATGVTMPARGRA